MQQPEREARATLRPLRTGARSPEESARDAIAAIDARMHALEDEVLFKTHPKASLSRGQRELIAAASGRASECFRSMDLHAACAIELLGREGIKDAALLVGEVAQGRFTSCDPKLRALLEIAHIVASKPSSLAQSHLDAAIAAGA